MIAVRSEQKIEAKYTQKYKLRHVRKSLLRRRKIKTEKELEQISNFPN